MRSQKSTITQKVSMPPVVCNKHTGIYLKRIPLLRYQTYHQTLNRPSDLTVWCTQLNTLRSLKDSELTSCDRNMNFMQPYESLPS